MPPKDEAYHGEGERCDRSQMQAAYQSHLNNLLHHGERLVSALSVPS